MQAEDFIHQYPYETPYPPRFDVSDLDPRLRLKTCQQPLAVEFARKDRIQGNTALKVGCPTTPGWKMLLPVRIDLFDDVLVLTRVVHKGQIIDTSLVKRQKKNISRLNNGYFSTIDAITGLETKRNLSRGNILTPASLTPKLMVKSGQQVTLILDYKGLEIRSTGKALQSARRGEVIKVRNNQSSRVVEGIVSGEAQVRINI
jgi:flagella basal body P-ring formation protein FlgA